MHQARGADDCNIISGDEVSVRVELWNALSWILAGIGLVIALAALGLLLR